MMAAVGSTQAVRKNLTNYFSEDVKVPKLRVLRRAVLAEQVCLDVSHHWPRGRRLVLVYAGNPDYGNWGNIRSAMNDGSALRLVLRQPQLDVEFLLPAQSTDVPEEQVMVVTELGQAYTVAQYRMIAPYRASR
ncbi:MAG TPA: hypothetical protein VFH88_08780, partial [Candidatus Krumholzibacteria bacterium]|nr:hypothetical protein [Candidatus Krumholzibacteria bacterium]